MTARDRMILMVLVAVAVLAAGYIAVVSPERSRASKLEAKVEAAKSTLSSAEAKLTEAQAAQRHYAAAYASIVSLGQAVPADQQVPSLIYEVNHASGGAKVSFQTITAGGSSAGGAAPSAATAGASGASAGFQALPFTFTFQGSFFDLYHLMQHLQGFTVSLKSGGVRVSGRLMTIQGLSLSGNGSGSSTSGPITSGSAASASKGSGSGQMTGTVTATAYVLPAGQGLTAGATPSAPSGASSASAPSGSTASTGNTVTAPAIVKAEP